jgi:hypothetical protein
MKRDLFAPVQALEPYELQPHQLAFHQNPAKYRAMVSGVGGGKTRMGCEEVRKINALYPGGLGVIGRLTSKSLKETTQRRFFEVIEPELIAKYNKQEEKVWLYTGRYADEEQTKPVFTEILFMHFDEPGPLGSLDISWFWIDEAHEPDGEEVPESVFLMLKARLRHPVGPHRGFITSNSGGKDWIYKNFFTDKVDKKVYWGLRVPTSANAKYLPPGYEEELRKDNPKIWVERFLEASFDAFEGQIFPDFDEDVHTFLPKDVRIKTQWARGAGFDFGVSAPTACVYGAMDNEGCLWIYDEDYEADADIPKFARKIKKKGFEYVLADPAVVQRGPNKKSPKELYQEEDVSLISSANDIDFFITLLTQMFRQEKIKISVRCKNLINQIKQAAWNPKTIAGTSLKEQMKIFENHALDALKYLVNFIGLNQGVLDAVRPGKGEIVVPKFIHPSYAEDEDFYNSDYVHRDIKKKVLYGR